ncbi:hypothetical protein JCM16358_18240 [Halanaerocella petrolearia]
MTITFIFTTVLGSFLFPFLLRMFWGKMVDNWGVIGGWMAALFLVGTTWVFNHGFSMIHQSGKIFIDMAWAAGVGVMVATAILGGKLRKAAPNLIGSIIGGIIAGLILAYF